MKFNRLFNKWPKEKFYRISPNIEDDSARPIDKVISLAAEGKEIEARRLLWKILKNGNQVH